MSVNNQFAVTLAGAGGVLPYTFQVIADANTTITASIAGNQLTVDATDYIPGVYSVHIRAIDSNGNSTDQVIPVFAADPTVFAILNDDYAYEPGVFPLDISQPLRSSGGIGTVIWELIPDVTTAPGITIDSNNNLVFTVTALGEWTVGVMATDSLGNVVTKLFTIAAQSSPAFAIVGGLAEILVNVPTSKTGTHNLTLTVGDSTGVTSIRKTFNYVANPEVSEIDFADSVVDYIWGSGDITTVVVPILGELTGFTLSSSGSILSNTGITISLDSDQKTVSFSGPPTAFGNSEIFVPVAVLKGTNQVATVTREFTLLSHSGTTDLGNVICNTMPYSVGDLIGLDPIKPFYNSPHYSKPSTLIVQVAPGSALPGGLNLDSNTGLIYGTITAANVNQSVLNYVDVSGVLHGTVTVNWDIQVSLFSLTDNCPVGQIQVPYSGTLSNSGTIPLSTVTVYRGRLPLGLTLAVDSLGQDVTIGGIPLESGVFDVWFRVSNQSNQTALIYKRFAVSYIQPLVIVTDSLYPILTGIPYAQFLTAFGGIAPYTWAVTSGSLPTGILLNPVTGELIGTTSVSSYSQDITISVTDTRGAVATAILNLTINNTLEIVTVVLPIITPSQTYNFQLLATGGTYPYTWSLASGSPSLPGGISLSSSGLLSGATSVEDYADNILFKVTDVNNNTATQSLELQSGITSGILIDTSGVGPIPRGGSYHGLLRAYGSGVAPFTWSVTPDTPHPLPAGISLSTDVTTQGATATLSGESTAVFTNTSVKVQVVDANGNSAFSYLSLSSYSSLAITTPSLPLGIVSGLYSVQLQATGYNPPFTWVIDGTSAALPVGYTLSSTGLLSGTSNSTYSGTVVIDVMDTLGDIAKASFSLRVAQSTLANTTTSLPQAFAGFPYAGVLSASGGTTPYVWSLAPTSPNLPAGLTLNASTGVISGTTTAIGFSANLIIRLSDATNFYIDTTFAFSVIAGLQLHTGPDYADSISTGYLGYEVAGDVTSINPRSNLSFYVIATGVIATNINQLLVTVPTGFTATVLSIQGGGTNTPAFATISISGSFNSGVVGDNNFTMSLVDSGVTVTQTFKWKVLPSSVLRLAPSSGTIPVLYLD